MHNALEQPVFVGERATREVDQIHAVQQGAPGAGQREHLRNTKQAARLGLSRRCTGKQELSSVAQGKRAHWRFTEPVRHRSRRSSSQCRSP
jgi:hypothetical protein